MIFLVVGTTSEVWGMESEDSIWCHRRELNLGFSWHFSCLWFTKCLLTGNVSYSHLEKQSPHTISDTCVLWIVLFSVAKSFQGVSAHFSLCQELDLLISVCGHALGLFFSPTMEDFYATTHIFSSDLLLPGQVFLIYWPIAVVQNGDIWSQYGLDLTPNFDFLNWMLSTTEKNR